MEGEGKRNEGAASLPASLGTLWTKRRATICLLRQVVDLLDSEAPSRQLVRLRINEGQLETDKAWRQDLILDPNDLHQLLLLQTHDPSSLTNTDH